MNTRRRPIDAPSCYHWTFAITAHFLETSIFSSISGSSKLRWKVKRSRRGEKTRSWRDFIELKRFLPADSHLGFVFRPRLLALNPNRILYVGTSLCVGMQVTRKIFREILSRRLITASLGRSRSNGCDVILEGNHIFLHDIKLFTGLFSTNLRSQDVKKKKKKKKFIEQYTQEDVLWWTDLLKCSVIGYYLISHRFLTERIRIFSFCFWLIIIRFSFIIFCREFEFYLLFQSNVIYGERRLRGYRI